jgi:carbonic anhydrase/acetyltransferase-like protein (isoleucine patch superfamily)
MLNLLPGLIIFLIWGGASFLAGSPFILIENSSQLYRLLYLTAAPLIFIIALPTIAGVLSRVAKKGIVPGKFPREPLHPVYLMRRIFNGCWTQLFYFKPVYSAVLAIPLLRTFIFRLFGYQGNMNFVVYPDTWLRDLPLLDIGPGVYLSNRATIGTNICLNDGHILVQGITFEEKALIGHMALLAPGGHYGAKCEIGVNAICGIRVKIGADSKVCPVAAVNHGSQIGNNVKIGTSSYVGLKSIIEDNIDVPPGAIIPDGTTIKNQNEMNNFFSAETQVLQKTHDTVTSILFKEFNVS